MRRSARRAIDRLRAFDTDRSLDVAADVLEGRCSPDEAVRALEAGGLYDWQAERA